MNRMKISARVANEKNRHDVFLETDGREHSLTIAPRPQGFGSYTNGGELLLLALATCYCNDVYREAAKRGIIVDCVNVEVSGEFGGPGEPARNISYRAIVDAKAPEAEVLELLRFTDTVAEIQNTLRASPPVLLAGCEARDTR
jgi:uncharacterized OsmC-like protein